MKVRLEEPRDRDASLEVERLAFGSEQEPSIVEAVRDEEGSFALVAEDDGRAVGHVQLSRAWVAETPVLALGPIGVVPERRRRGTGSALMRAALEEARARGEVAVILFGDPAFYGRFGFEPGSNLGLHNPFAGMTLPNGTRVVEENLMLAPLDDRARSVSGEIRWHAALANPPVEAEGPAP